MHRWLLHVFVSTCAASWALAAGPPSYGIEIATVPVGNPGNTGARAVVGDDDLGAVDYSYRIGKYEVTNREYVSFLNGADPTGTNNLELYNAAMTDDALGGITLDAHAGLGLKYGLKPGRGANPVNHVSWFDAVRFANWLHNGQGFADTESGAYTLLGGTPVPTNAANVARNPDAKWFLPTESEWFKAAYHKNDGVTGNYWDLPMATDLHPYSDEPPGSDAPMPSNTGNFIRDDGISNGYNDGLAVSGSPLPAPDVNYLTDVGSYGDSVSPYGTYDQAGNVGEWTETPYFFDTARRVRGGSFGHEWDFARSGTQTGASPTFEWAAWGFRVANVPEPNASVWTILIGILAVNCTSRGQRHCI